MKQKIKSIQFSQAIFDGHTLYGEGETPMAYEYVKQAYGVNPQIGARVRHNEIDKYGEIVRRRTYDNYVYVRFDGEKFAKPCHPKALDYPVENSDA